MRCSAGGETAEVKIMGLFPRAIVMRTGTRERIMSYSATAILHRMFLPAQEFIVFRASSNASARIAITEATSPSRSLAELKLA
jgi:hypothetical protein